MGKRGPLPTNRDRLLRHGNTKAKYQAGSSAEYDGQAVDTPAGLSIAAGELFASIQERLVSLGCWDSVFAIPLQRYAELWGLWTTVTNREVVFTNDLVKLNTALLNLESRFGLTPSDRERLHCTRQEPEDKSKMRFFGPKLTS
jgi:phage terminase small subunit